jgi:WD40 repeat protein
LVAALLQIAPAFGQNPGIKHWELTVATTDADLSPDDRLLAVTVETVSGSHNGHEQAVESVQVWDYESDRKISDAQLANYPRIAPTPNVVRFTADGKLLVVSEPTKLHVLEASALKPVRVIEPPLGDYRIFHVETGPNGHIAIVGANRDAAGMLFAYDLDSGGLLFQSNVSGVTSIAWNPDGKRFAAATAFFCTGKGTIQVFDTNPWQHVRTLEMRRDLASLTFSENHLYAVQTSRCKGSISNRHLGMEAFDLATWKRQKTLFLPHKDIHGSVSYAGGRLLANTGKVESQFDWLDAVTWSRDLSVEFTVWGDDARSEMSVFAPSTVLLRPPESPSLRFSRTGKMILLKAKKPQVFQLP